MGRYKEPFTLIKRGDYWYYRTYDDKGVRTVAKSTGFKSKNQAKEYCNALYRAGALWSSNKTFGVYAKGFYDDDGLYNRDRIEPMASNTLKYYRSIYKNNIEGVFYHIRLSDINYTTLKDFRSSLVKDGKSISSILGTMNVLKHIIDYAYRDRVIPVNPFDLLEPLQVKEIPRDAFTLEEVAYLLANVNPKFHNILLLMALSGMRISEAIGVTESDIVQADGFKFINLTKQKNKGKYIPLKNKECREIPISDSMVSLIGYPYQSVSFLYREFDAIRKDFKDGEERKLSYHSLRHFFATNSKANNVADVKVEKILGHSLKGMSNIYTNFKASDLVDIIPWQIETEKKISALVQRMRADE